MLDVSSLVQLTMGQSKSEVCYMRITSTTSYLTGFQSHSYSVKVQSLELASHVLKDPALCEVWPLERLC